MKWYYSAPGTVWMLQSIACVEYKQLYNRVHSDRDSFSEVVLCCSSAWEVFRRTPKQFCNLTNSCSVVFCLGSIAELSTGQMDPRVRSGRVGSGRIESSRVGSRVGSGHDFAGFWRIGRVGRVSTLVFADQLWVSESIWIFEYCIRIGGFSTIFNLYNKQTIMNIHLIKLSIHIRF